MRYFHGDPKVALHIGSSQRVNENVTPEAWCESHRLDRVEIIFTRQVNYAQTRCIACRANGTSRRRASDRQEAFIRSLVRQHGRDTALELLAEEFAGQNVRYVLNHPTADEASTIIGLLKREAN
jgi:hypothetical protein